MRCMDRRSISLTEATELVDRGESHFWDHKSARSSGAVIQKIGAALANTEGGEFAVGIEDKKTGEGLDRWVGFSDVEDANPVLDALARDLDPPAPFDIEFLSIEGDEDRGLVALVTIRKSESVHYASDGKVYVRRSASTTSITGRSITDLNLSKGARSYEDQFLSDYTLDDLVEESELQSFLESYSPATAAADFARKQRLYDRTTHAARLAAAILYAESPSSVAPKRCAVKIARYNTKDEEPRREHLVGTPISIEGPARLVIEETLRRVTEMFESVSVLRPDGTMTPMSYPPEALKEVVVNAVIHRDYNVSDDILVSVLNNRVEVRSPGGLPGYMKLDNLLRERFSRNPTVVRLLNKYPDPPNKDIGEGLRTVLDKMAEARLKEPKFFVNGGYFTVQLGHTPLARPEEIVMEYLDSHPEISNSVGRNLTGIRSENAMKDVFYHLRDAGKIERVPGKAGSKSAWRVLTREEALQQGQLDAPTLGYPDSTDAPTFDFSAEVDEASAETPFASTARFTRRRRFTVRSGRAPGRNLPCPCGSGRKYKKCHGAISY